ncbi:MAG: GtrA family protein [Patescibacteria group bacterium]
MKVIDIVFALICGWMVNWIAFDILESFGINFGLWRWLLSWVLPIIALACLWVAFVIGKKRLLVFQAAKHILIGAFATVVDLKIFEGLVILFSSTASVLMVFKGISFLLSTSLKYWGNKHWAFEKFEKESLSKEILQFIIITLVGLVLDTGSFFYFTKIMGVQFGLSFHLWTEFSVIFAAIIAAVWNFCGYKFIVFKK